MTTFILVQFLHNTLQKKWNKEEQFIAKYKTSKPISFDLNWEVSHNQKLLFRHMFQTNIYSGPAKAVI